MALTQGPDLSLISTERLGFLSVAGDARLRLTSQWAPGPAPNSSLLSVASRKGLVAAAGPDAISVATTEAVRKAFEGPKDGDSQFRPFEPQLKLPLPMRISQLAFTADENYLVISAERGGGLAVYDVQALLQGSKDSAFQIPTNGEALRSLVPNPTAEKGELCAVVTDKGNLLMANLQKKDFIPGTNGQILKTQVSCAAWSTKGKQLVAGLGDGTIHQMTPEGEVKAQIPRPPSLDGNYFVSFLVWLENHVFLTVHVSTAEQPPKSAYHLITRQGPDFVFQNLTDPVDPFGSDKIPQHTAVRLKDFDTLQDLLIFSSTATPDIGLVTRSTEPLSSENVTNTFATTELLDDSKRATLPMGDSMDTPAPIGTALDLSGKEPVYKPIPTDEMNQSPGPLPGYWVLNDEGVLSVWWIIYTESIRGGTTYQGMAALAGSAAPPIASPKPTQPIQSTPFSSSSATPFGASAAVPSAFGAPSTIGAKSSPWGSQPSSSPNTGGATFGSSTFGSAAASVAPKLSMGSGSTGSMNNVFGQIGSTPPAAPKPGSSLFGGERPAFGQSSGLGVKPSPWASTASTSSPAFGQSGFASAATGSSGVFGNPTGANTAGGFASFANKGGFASLGSNNDNSDKNIFATSKPPTADTSMDTEVGTSFPPLSSKPTTSSGSLFGSQPFKLTSSFQRDPNARDDDATTEDSSGGKSMFGSGFASTMGEATKPVTSGLFGDFGGTQSTTPTTTPAPSKFLSQGTTAPPSSGIFGFPAKSNDSIFGTPAQTLASETPQIKVEAETPKPLKDLPDAPLPPDATSKAPYPLGDSSSSSAYSAADSPDTRKAPSDAPLPPDFLPSKSKTGEKLPPPPDSPPGPVEDAPLPPDPVKNKKIYDVKLPPLPILGDKTDPEPEPKPEPPKPEPEPSQKPGESVFKPTYNVSGFTFPRDLPPAEITDEEEEDDEGEDEDEQEENDAEEASEGSGVDVAEDLSPPSGSKDKTTPAITPGSSFDGGLGGSFSTISRPEPERKSLFGEIGRSVPSFPQPNPISPRSPSPVRSTIPSRLTGEQPRSFSAPGMASQILGASKRPQSRGAPIISRDTPIEDTRFELQRRARAKKEAEEVQLLVDEEDDIKQNQLRAPIQPTLVLDEFIAHAGPLPSADDNVPAQVEAVYRDINAMIDTLGLNARSLTNFIQGHAETFVHGNRDKHDLSNSDDWTIGELDRLRVIISEDLVNDLEDARVEDVQEKVADCQDLQRDLTRDRSKRNDLQKLMSSRLDPDQALTNRSLPLTAEQAARQNDLRRDFARFTKLLAEAEEGLTLLRAKIASANTANGKNGQTPTIEAVMRTIAKMTSMVERRSGDVDVLENQMRKLRFSSPAVNTSRSREGTPTPKKLGSSLMFSPDRSFRDSTPQRSSMRHSMSASVGSIGGGMFAVRTPPRKKMSGFGEVEKKAVKERKDKRAIVLGKLKASVQKRGANVLAVDDIE
ncbi:hypothetical protein BJ170DRAFT_601564 [Xylariales sp. AK1849]|nr:hypothetical protein BJ170DRAFT_601564 [Xylariales sp. AK1849]